MRVDLSQPTAEELEALRCPINIYPHEMLTTPALPVDEKAFGQPALGELILRMYATMRMSNGVGIAANQVNQPYDDDAAPQILIIQLPDQKPYFFINPRIVYNSGEYTFEEGCLSFPSFFVKKTRYDFIRIAYRDFDGEHLETSFSNFGAIVMQHEMEHLRGETFVDDLSDLKKSRARKKVANWVKKNKLP